MQSWLVRAPRQLAMAGRALAMVLGAAALEPLRGAPLTDHTDHTHLPQMTDVPQSTARGGTLDGTLQVDTDAAQRNLELLLETRGEGEPMLPPAARRPMPGSPDAAASAGSRPAEAVSQWQQAGRTDDDRALRSRVIGKIAQILREHRLWLLGAFGLVAALAIGARLWQRQRAGAAERRQRGLTEAGAMQREAATRERGPGGAGRRRRSSRPHSE